MQIREELRKNENMVWNEFAGCWDYPCGLTQEEGCPHIPPCKLGV